MKFYSIFLAFTVAASVFTSCKKDNNTESENITKVVVHLTAPGFDQEFEVVETNGDGVWDSYDEIILPSLTGDINCELHLYDGAEELNAEIESESNAHLFTFKVSGADLNIKPNDSDGNGKPFNLNTLWDAGDASNGSVQIKLHHEPSDKTANEPGGEIDLDVTFVVKIQ
ncbi:MAG: hypothetical protein ACKVT2_17075 [Saprospiraceae bacterium]